MTSVCTTRENKNTENEEKYILRALNGIYTDGVNITHAEAIWILGTLRTSIIVND